jgi:hypothetical protein
MYFFLNFWSLKYKEIGKGMKPPQFTDVNMEIALYLDDCRANNKHATIVKRRQVGATEFLAACCARQVLLFPKAEVLIASGEEKKARILYKKCLDGISAMSRIGGDWGREFYKDIVNRDKDDSGCWFGKKRDGIEIGYGSHLVVATLSESAEAGSGLSPTFVVLDEQGLIGKLKSAVQFIRPSMEESGFTGGRLMVLNGTGGEMEDGVAQVEDIFLNPEKFHFHGLKNEWYPDRKIGLFISGAQYNVMDSNGNSIKGPSSVLVKERRKSLQTDAKALHAERVAFPLEPSEALTISGHRAFDTVLLKKQIDFVNEQDISAKLTYGRLDWILDSNQVAIGVEWVDSRTTGDGSNLQKDDDGDLLYPIVMLEHPKFKGWENGYKRYFETGEAISDSYSLGTDSYDKTEAKTTDSKLACAVIRGYTGPGEMDNMFVCWLNWRPKMRDKVYEMTYKMSAYYNGKNLVEDSNQLLFEYYKQNNGEKYLYPKPQWAEKNIKHSQNTSKYGIHPTTKKYWESDYAQYIVKYSGRMFYWEQLERAMTYKSDKNDDMTIACMLAWQQQKDKHYIIEKYGSKSEQSTYDYLHGEQQVVPEYLDLY